MKDELRNELRRAEAAYRRAARAVEDRRRARNQLVRRALTQGWTHAAIAEETGLSRGRINQIAKTSEGPSGPAGKP
jgi:DNA-binding NarL/FixJ family response regulator